MLEVGDVCGREVASCQTTVHEGRGRCRLGFWGGAQGQRERGRGSSPIVPLDMRLCKCEEQSDGVRVKREKSCKA